MKNRERNSFYKSGTGHLYIMEFEHGCKIGRSINPTTRTNAIQSQAGLSCTNLFISPRICNYYKAECEMKKHFKSKSLIGEYFKVPFDEIVSKYNDMNFELANVMTESERKKETEESGSAFDIIRCADLEKTGKLIAFEEAQDWDRWKPQNEEIEIVLKFILEEIDSLVEIDELEEVKELEKTYNLVKNSDGEKQRTLMQEYLSFMRESAPPEIFGKETDDLFNNALGIDIVLVNGDEALKVLTRDPRRMTNREVFLN